MWEGAGCCLCATVTTRRTVGRGALPPLNRRRTRAVPLTALPVPVSQCHKHVGVLCAAAFSAGGCSLDSLITHRPGSHLGL